MVRSGSTRSDRGPILTRHILPLTPSGCGDWSGSLNMVKMTKGTRVNSRQRVTMRATNEETTGVLGTWKLVVHSPSEPVAPGGSVPTHLDQSYESAPLSFTATGDEVAAVLENLPGVGMVMVNRTMLNEVSRRDGVGARGEGGGGGGSVLWGGIKALDPHSSLARSLSIYPLIQPLCSPPKRSPAQRCD